MHKSTLIQLVKSLNRKEITRLGEFAHSPYFNKHKDVRNLIDYFNSLFPNLTEAKLNRKRIFTKLFGKLEYEDTKLKHVISYTLKLVERFLAHEQFGREQNDLDLYLLRELRQRKLSKRFEKTFSNAKKQLDKDQLKNFDHHLQVYAAVTEADKYFLERSSYKRDQNLQFKVDSLDRFYLSEKLRNACEMLNRRRFLNIEYEFNLLDKTMEYLEENTSWWENIPSIEIYFLVYQTLTNPQSGDSFYQLIEVLDRNALLFPVDERRDLYFYALNFCIRAGNRGDGKYYVEVFKLYRRLIETELIFENGYLQEVLYRNIAASAIRVQNYEWTEEFINKYKDRLPPSTSENAYNYTLSSLYYSTKEYEKALALLNTITFTDLVYNLDAKTLLLKIYYDLEETEALNSLVDSFRQYLTRNTQLAKAKIKRYGNLFTATKNVYRYKMNREYMSKKAQEREYQKLVEKTNTTNALAGHLWIRGKVDELQNKKRSS